MLIHSNEQKTQCHICKLMVADVKSHIDYVHGKKEKEECRECGIKVKHLKAHMNLKHGGKGKRENISCPKCKKLMDPTSFRAHLLIHTGEQKTQCHICKKMFSTAKIAKRHMSDVHGKK